MSFNLSGQLTCPCTGPNAINIDASAYGNGDNEVNITELTPAVLPYNVLNNTCLAIKGKLIINSGFGYTIIGGEIKMQPGSSIETGIRNLKFYNVNQNGGIHGCTEEGSTMWKGIQALSAGVVYDVVMNNCIIQDAQNAINVYPAPFGGAPGDGAPRVSMTDTELKRNYIGINITEGLFPGGPTITAKPYLKVLKNVNFIGTDDILPYNVYWAPEESYAGIKTSGEFNLFIPDAGFLEGEYPCTFSDLQFGIHVEGETAIIKGCKFERCLNTSILALSTELTVERCEILDFIRYGIGGSKAEVEISDSKFTSSIPIEDGVVRRTGISFTNLISANIFDNEFTHHERGIFLLNSPAKIKNNIFYEQNNAIYLYKPGLSQFTIQENILTNMVSGISINPIAAETGFDIFDNEISAKAGAGIFLLGETFSEPAIASRRIYNNTISSNHRGIMIAKTSDIEIFGQNTITIPMNNEHGIFIYSSPNCSIAENTISVSDNASGIRILASLNTKINCNHILSNSKGPSALLYLSGDSSCLTEEECTEIKGNTFSYSRDENSQYFYGALKIDGVTSPQIRTGNKWEGFTMEPEDPEEDEDENDDFIMGAYYRGSDPFLMNKSRFVVQDDMIPYHPQKIRNNAGEVDEFFVLEGGSFYDSCLPPEEEVENIVNVSLINTHIANYQSIRLGKQSMLHKDLYEKLSYHPELVDAPELVDFMLANQQTTIGEFHKINADMRVAGEFTVEEKALLGAYQSLLKEIKTEIDETIVLIEENIGGNLENLLDIRNQLQKNLRETFESILDIQETKKQRVINQSGLSLVENASIITNNIIDQNQKELYVIILEHIQNDVDVYTALQQVSLQSIAIQCPQEGGGAVIDARQLLGVFIDDEACEASTNLFAPLVNPSPVVTTVAKVEIYPNPAQQHFTVQIKARMGEEMPLFVLFTANGQAVFEESISGTGILEVDVSHFITGIYYYKIISNKEIIDAGKMVITN